MRFTPERKIILGFCSTLVALGLLSAGAWWNAVRLESTFRWADHTHRVLYELETLRNDVLHLQTESQRYVITGDATCLDRWAVAARQARDSSERLGDLTGDNPEQYQRVVQLDPLISQVIALTQQRHELREKHGQEAVFAEVGKGTVRRAVDEFAARAESIETVEQNLLGQRTAEAQAAGKLSFTVVLASCALAAALGLLAVLLTLRDLRRRQQAEAELERFFTLSHDLLCIAGFDGYFKRVNPAWEKTLGFTAAELTSRPYMEFIHPEDQEPTRAQATRQAGGHDAMAFENRYLCKDGSYRWLQWNARPTTMEQLIIATARDVTDSKLLAAEIHRSSQQVQAANQQLRAVNAELEAFSYSVSHDLRAPLRHIDGFAALLQTHAGDVLDEKGRRFVSTISAAARQMGRLIDDLLSFSRMGRAELHFMLVDQAALVAEVARESGLNRTGPAIEWHIAPLPAIQCDGAMLRQVWVNLIGNAVKYSGQAPQPRIEIGVQPETGAGEHVFFVRDNGVGFDMKYVDKLFGVFQRLHSDSEFEGTGIGLANVRRIITRHGGRTWAEGCVGAGSVFYFSVPVTLPAARPPA